MTNSLSPRVSNTITILISILVALLTIVTSYQYVIISEQNAKIEHQNERLEQLPEKYVMLERYACDINELRITLRTIDNKLDRAIWPYKAED